MPYPGYTTEEVARLGQELYDQQIRRKVEERYRGQFLVLDVETGEYEIAPDDLTASDQALKKNPQAKLFGLRIGSPTAYRLGRHVKPLHHDQR